MLKWFAPAALLAATAAAESTTGSGSATCYCTDSAGGRVELGETICLQVDGRMFTAQCQMSLNVPMWREIGSGCQSSRAEPAQPVIHPGPVHPHV